MNTFSQADHDYMALAIQLAKRGIYTTSPNPNVGCVVVKAQQVIATGWHKRAGTGHAEVNAFAQLTPEQCHGSTAYVTLEPCSHFGRTPPCAQLLIDANVARVVIAMVDPNPSVAGRGVAMLEQAGIEVEVGLLEQDARALNPGFLSAMERKRPFIQVKLAASLDGKTALENGQSQWITGPQARSDVQTYRAKACAILSTATTVLADDASFNVRSSQLNFAYPLDDINPLIRQPKRLILDSKNQLSRQLMSKLNLFKHDSEIILIRKTLTGEFAGIENIKEAQINYDDGFDLTQLLELAAQWQINLLWVEAGGTLAASFVEQGLYDQLICYFAPKIIGQGGQEMLPIGRYTSMQQIPELVLQQATQLGNDLKLIYTK